jgi:hypothetical protein
VGVSVCVELEVRVPVGEAVSDGECEPLGVPLPDAVGLVVLVTVAEDDIDDDP